MIKKKSKYLLAFRQNWAYGFYVALHLPIKIKIMINKQHKENALPQPLQKVSNNICIFFDKLPCLKKCLNKIN